METNIPGLSTLHISTVEPARVRFYTRGNLSTVNRSFSEKACLVCGEPFKVPTWEVERHQVCRTCRRMLAGCDEPKRGEVTHFSLDSRRRLMRLLATIDSGTRPHLVTLTFPDSYSGYQEPEDWKRLINVFQMRFMRAFPEGAYIWRLETVERKSGTHVGEVFPHFHLLVFGVEYNRLRFWVSGAWYETVGTGDVHHLNAGTQVAKVLSRKGIFRYASKTVAETMSRELGKTVQALGKVGRWWGIAFRDNFSRFISPAEELQLEDGEAVQLIRYFRRLSHGLGRAYSRLTAFIDGAWCVKNLVRLVAPGGSGNAFRATGRRYDVPFWLFAYQAGMLVPKLE